MPKRGNPGALHAMATAMLDRAALHARAGEAIGPGCQVAVGAFQILYDRCFDLLRGCELHTAIAKDTAGRDPVLVELPELHLAPIRTEAPTPSIRDLVLTGPRMGLQADFEDMLGVAMVHMSLGAYCGHTQHEHAFPEAAMPSGHVFFRFTLSDEHGAPGTSSVLDAVLLGAMPPADKAYLKLRDGALEQQIAEAKATMAQREQPQRESWENHLGRHEHRTLDSWTHGS